jgi:hypothetical protein
VIREYLYVDVQRTRSLLAQLEDGVVEQQVKRTALDDAAELGASLLGIGGKGAWSAHESYEESRSLMDLTAVIFEEAAASQGLIVDIDPSQVPEEWSDGTVHSILREGEILRATGEILITDPAYIGARFEGLDGFMSDLVEMQVGIARDALRALRDAELEGHRAQLQSANANQRKQIERKLRALDEELEAAARRSVEDELGAKGVDQMRGIMKVLQSYLGSAISVRLLACGLDRPEHGFAGSLLGRDSYLQREREELYSRYGSVLSGWTMLMQVARIPTEEATSSARIANSSDWGELAAGGSINRAAFEGVASQLLQMMESIGVAEGPRFPTISVVPLAIYRPIPEPGSSSADGAADSEPSQP